MTNQQGAPEAPSYEHQRAIMEGERNASLDAYSRVVYLTQTESRIYEAAFTNGWNRLAALVEAQQPVAHVQNPAEIEHVAGDVSKNGAESNMAQQPAPSEQQPFGWIKQSEIDSSKDFGGSINLWRQKYDCDVPVYLAQQPAPSAAAAGQRRSDLVPGVMHCAKCKFQLNRVTLCVSDGNAYAGNNETEPCPNGCGPLWPVTWEQEARNCWKALEEMHERLHPAPTPQADSRPAPVEVADAMADSQYLAGVSAGWNAANADDPNAALQKLQESRAGHLKPLRAARAQADSVTAPAGPSKSLPYEPTSAMLIAARERDPALPIETVRAIYWSMWRTAPTPPAQAAGSVLEDADPLQGAANWLAEAHGQFCVAVLQGCLMIGYNRAKRLHDAAIAARKQGGANG